MNSLTRFSAWWRFCRSVLQGLTGISAFSVLLLSASAADYYLKFSDLPGGIKEGGFTGWTKLSGISANTQHVIPTDPTVQPPTSVEVRFTLPPAQISPPLLVRCATGAVTPRITLACVDGGKAVQRITMTNVLISSYQSSGDGGPPVDVFACRFGSIEWSYSEHDGLTGGTTATFDLKANRGELKQRPFFRAVLQRNPPGGQSGMQLSCPVEAGHRYRVMGNSSLTGPWLPLSAFTAETDGTMNVTVPTTAPVLFLRVEEIE